MAVMTPKGIDSVDDTNVTAREATINGKIPKSGGSDVGYHSVPKMKSLMDTFAKIGIPSEKRKKTIIPRVVMHARAINRKVRRMICSLNWRVMVFKPRLEQRNKPDFSDEFLSLLWVNYIIDEIEGIALGPAVCEYV